MQKGFAPILILVGILVIIGIAGGAYYLGKSQNSQPKSQSQVVSQTPTPSPNANLVPNASAETANWKTYINDTYAFQIKYPEKFNLNENIRKENFYDNLVSISYQNTKIISIRAIYDIDIYENTKTQDVAIREVVDSGFKYNITTALISGYNSTITILEKSQPLDNLSLKFHTIATIAHPKKNLFIEISSSLNKEELDQILSTFKFTQ